MRAVFVVLAVAFLASGCSDDKPVATESQAQAQQILKQDCSNPKWRKENLGLWYSVCRRPMQW